MKNIWNSAWEFPWDLFSHPPKSNKTVKESQEKAKNKSEIPSGDVDPLMDVMWDMPSFCKND